MNTYVAAPRSFEGALPVAVGALWCWLLQKLQKIKNQMEQIQGKQEGRCKMLRYEFEKGREREGKTIIVKSNCLQARNDDATTKSCNNSPARNRCHRTCSRKAGRLGTTNTNISDGQHIGGQGDEKERRKGAAYRAR
jgi:hypothetical protein